MSLFAAIDAAGHTRYIGEVVRGAGCACVCAECGSPVVAKHGDDQVWHFAHEASQERPQCFAGSLNLLRRLAIELLLAEHLPLLPPFSQLVTAAPPHADITEWAMWELREAAYACRYPLAPRGSAIAELELHGFPGVRIALWVQIGESSPHSSGAFSGELVYFCPAPSTGSIRSHANALEYLQRSSRWIWMRCPDVYGALEAALANVAARVGTSQARQELARQRTAPRLARPDGAEAADVFAAAPGRPQAPYWTRLKKDRSSYFAFEMRAAGESWIVMEAADLPGYYVVPGAGLVDGWDEALPISLGKADVRKGAYYGDGAISHAIFSLRSMGEVGSRIDSDAALIAAFTGWREFPEPSGMG